MKVYLASPNTQQQAEHASGMPVLLSYGVCAKIGWIWTGGYAATFDGLLGDSGAFSQHTKGIKIDLGAFRAWGEEHADHFVAVAGLDDISGDWRRSLANYEAFPLGFPTFHETDPPEFLDDLIPMAIERRNWIGLGLLPETRQRRGGESWIRDACDRIPPSLHVHGWAMRGYAHIGRLDSVDSTNWWRDAMKLRTMPDLGHLTYGECLAIVVKRYQRWERIAKADTDTTPLFREGA